MFGRIKPKHPITEKNGVKYKVCSRCEQDLPIESFDKRSKYETRRLSICRDCARVTRRINRDKKKARDMAKKLNLNQ